MNVSVTVHCVLGYISQDTCYYFDFDAENCFPWNTTLCPEPVVAYRVKKCPSYECFVVSKKSSFFIATIVQYFLQTPEDKVATPDSASSSRSQPTTYPSSPTPRTRTNIDPAIDDGGGKEMKAFTNHIGEKEGKAIRFRVGHGLEICGSGQAGHFENWNMAGVERDPGGLGFEAFVI